MFGIVEAIPAIARKTETIVLRTIGCVFQGMNRVNRTVTPFIDTRKATGTEVGDGLRKTKTPAGSIQLHAGVGGDIPSETNGNGDDWNRLSYRPAGLQFPSSSTMLFDRSVLFGRSDGRRASLTRSGQVIGIASHGRRLRLAVWKPSSSSCQGSRLRISRVPLSGIGGGVIPVARIFGRLRPAPGSMPIDGSISGRR